MQNRREQCALLLYSDNDHPKPNFCSIEFKYIFSSRHQQRLVAEVMNLLGRLRKQKQSCGKLRVKFYSCFYSHHTLNKVSLLF